MTRTPPLRLGTRSSPLARIQAALVAARLAPVPCEMVFVSTAGDRDRRTPLAAFGGPGVFTNALEQALRDHTIDAAVHSLKDIPTGPADGIALAAMAMREDARDVLVAREPWTLDTLPEAATVGTCSTRRAAQLRAARPDLVLAPIRGNVESRVRKAFAGDYEAIVLAAAGLARLQMTRVIREYLPFTIMLPAPGQGALGVQCRAEDHGVRALLEDLDEPDVRAAAEAERSFMEALGGGCSAPVAAYAHVDTAAGSRRVTLDGALGLTGGMVRRVLGTAPVHEACLLGQSLAREAAGAAAPSS